MGLRIWLRHLGNAGVATTTGALHSSQADVREDARDGRARQPHAARYALRRPHPHRHSPGAARSRGILAEARPAPPDARPRSQWRQGRRAQRPRHLQGALQGRPHRHHHLTDIHAPHASRCECRTELFRTAKPEAGRVLETTTPKP